MDPPKPADLLFSPLETQESTESPWEESSGDEQILETFADETDDELDLFDVRENCELIYAHDECDLFDADNDYNSLDAAPEVTADSWPYVPMDMGSDMAPDSGRVVQEHRDSLLGESGCPEDERRTQHRNRYH